MANQNVDTESYIIAFTQKEPAERAYQLLKDSGLTEEQVVLDYLLADTINIERSQALKSASGGAIVGTVLGGLIGLMISLPSHLLTPLGSDFTPLSPIGIILFGSGVGAASMSLIAAMSGMNVPKTNPQEIDESKTYQYRVIIVGEQEYERAQGILQQQGMLANT